LNRFEYQPYVDNPPRFCIHCGKKATTFICDEFTRMRGEKWDCNVNAIERYICDCNTIKALRSAPQCGFSEFTDDKKLLRLEYGFDDYMISINYTNLWGPLETSIYRTIYKHNVYGLFYETIAHEKVLHFTKALDLSGRTGPEIEKWIQRLMLFK